MLDPGLTALLGAVVGSLGTLGASWITGWNSRQLSKKDRRELVEATALLMQDDFYHFQVTLARALDRPGWWIKEELLEQQASVSDRKTIWAALPDKSIEEVLKPSASLTYLTNEPTRFRPKGPITITNAVADAQGWMDYLTQRRKAAGSDLPTSSDFETMKWSFALLDVGRTLLASLANRPATDFSQSHVVSKTVAVLLGSEGSKKSDVPSS